MKTLAMAYQFEAWPLGIGDVKHFTAWLGWTTQMFEFVDMFDPLMTFDDLK